MLQLWRDEGPSSRYEEYLIRHSSLAEPAKAVSGAAAASSVADSAAATCDNSVRTRLRQSEASSSLPALSYGRTASSDSGPRTTTTTTASRSCWSAVDLQSTRRSSSNNNATNQPQPDRGTFQCAFFFLGCPVSRDTVDTWTEHCQSHFKCHKPPTSAQQCPFCGAVQPAGVNAWQERMDHVAEHHRNGERLDPTTCRKDTGLYRYLWSKGIVDGAQYQDLVRTGRCDGAGEAYTQSSRSDRRMRR